MKRKPCISVIMPVYNVERYVSNAVESIINQTFEDFEFIIIDDASTDNTHNIVSSYKDPRIILIKNKKQMGVALSLNKGIRCAQGDYIIRMDGDDISSEKRFEVQISYMKHNTRIGICGSHMDIIDKNGTLISSQKKRIGYENIKIGLFWGHTSLAHPSIIMRKNLLDKFQLRYDQAYYYAEDYDLFCRSSLNFVMDNIPEKLIKYRVHTESVSNRYNEHQRIDARMALFLHLRRLGIDINYKEFKLHSNFFLKLPNEPNYSLDDKATWIQQLVDFNKKNKIFDHCTFRTSCDQLIKNNL